MTIRLLTGDCRRVLESIPDASVQCCVTSPPYFGLRDYGTATWIGGDPECDHVAAELRRGVNLAKSAASTRGGAKKVYVGGIPFRQECGKCGARREDDQIGLELTPDDYIAALVGVFREVWRVLRDDGTLWLNLGDSYATGAGKVGDRPGGGAQGDRWRDIAPMTPANRMPIPGLKPKDLIGIPWRVALALQADGWYLRSDIIWHKPNPMPESVTDRPTKAHEYLFLMAKSERYYYDAAAIAEPSMDTGGNGSFAGRQGGARDTTVSGGRGTVELHPYGGTRNRRTVWTIATVPYAGAHFATFPPALAEPCILAGSAAKACETCGAPWRRMAEKATSFECNSARAGRTADDINGSGKWRNGGAAGNANLKSGPIVAVVTIGFAPTCDCETNTGAARSVVLDPFGGAGTVGLVCDEFQRDAILIELNPEHTRLAEDRIARGLERSDIDSDAPAREHDFGPLFA